MRGIRRLAVGFVGAEVVAPGLQAALSGWSPRLAAVVQVLVAAAGLGIAGLGCLDLGRAGRGRWVFRAAAVGWWLQSVVWVALGFAIVQASAGPTVPLLASLRPLLSSVALALTASAWVGRLPKLWWAALVVGILASNSFFVGLISPDAPHHNAELLLISAWMVTGGMVAAAWVAAVVQGSADVATWRRLEPLRWTLRAHEVGLRLRAAGGLGSLSLVVLGSYGALPMSRAEMIDWALLLEGFAAVLALPALVGLARWAGVLKSRLAWWAAGLGGAHVVLDGALFFWRDQVVLGWLMAHMTTAAALAVASSGLGTLAMAAFAPEDAPLAGVVRRVKVGLVVASAGLALAGLSLLVAPSWVDLMVRAGLIGGGMAVVGWAAVVARVAHTERAATVAEVFD